MRRPLHGICLCRLGRPTAWPGSRRAGRPASRGARSPGAVRVARLLPGVQAVSALALPAPGMLEESVAPCPQALASPPLPAGGGAFLLLARTAVRRASPCWASWLVSLCRPALSNVGEARALVPSYVLGGKLNVVGLGELMSRPKIPPYSSKTGQRIGHFV